MRILGFVLIGCLAGAGVAAAQTDVTPGTPNADAHFVVGWQNLHKEQSTPQHYNDWLNGIFYGGAGAGWYWNDHLKTQIDIGAGTRGTQYRFEDVVVNGVHTGQSSRVSVRQDSVSIGQQYQFFRNQWFHPHVGAGIDLARETVTEQYQPIFFFDNVTRTSGQLAPAHPDTTDHNFIARPFAEAGFKAYMTRRAFFSGDSRVMIRSGIDEVLFRFGFGIDF
jgi:hypothetical protein